MNSLDYILLIPLLWGLVRGFLKGFILQLAGIAALVLGLLGASHFSSFVAAFLEQHWGWKYGHVQLVAFAVLFVAIVIVIFVLARIMEKAVKVTGLSIVNKVAGALLGAAKFFLIMGGVLYLLHAVQNTISIIPPKLEKESVLFDYYIKGIKIVVPAVTKLEKEKLPGV